MRVKKSKIIGISPLFLSSTLGIIEVGAETVPQPSGRIIERGEDGVFWELYENGYLLFKPVPGKDTLATDSVFTTWKWRHGDKIKYVGFSGKVYAPRDSSYLFSKVTTNESSNFNPVYIDVSKIDTSRVTDMSYMFYEVSNLSSLDVINWDTSKVTNMNYMFTKASRLVNLDVSRWNTSKVRTALSMFLDASSLTSLDVSKWNTSQFITTANMFQNIPGLRTLDIGGWDLKNVRTSSGMFADTSLIKLTLPTSFTELFEMNEPSMKDLPEGEYTNSWVREDKTYGPMSWGEMVNNWQPAMAGTWVRERKGFTLDVTYDMGTHPSIPKMTATIFKNTDPKIKDTFVSDFVLPTPKNPENLRFVGWRASKDPSAAIITKENMLGFYLLAEIGHVTLYPKWEAIPKEPKTVTEVIEPTKEYVIDETRDKGAKNLETPGKKGSKTTKITYTIHPETGVATENRGEPVIDSAGKTVVKVAAKPETRQVVGNDGNKYEETTRYTINASNGDLTPNSTRRLVENTKAIEAINAEARKKNDEIEAANITQEAKTRLKAKVEGERTKGINAVKKMDTVEKGNAERDKAITAIRAISLDADKQAKGSEDLQKAKEIGINAIKKAAEDKKVEINAANLLPEAKSRLFAQVESEKNKGIEAVNKATNSRSVESETTKAVGVIKAISLEDDKEAKKVQDAKASAINAIKQAAKEKTDEIENANILPEAKVRLKNQVEAEKNKGIDAVGKAINVAGVNSERDKAIGIIRGIGLDVDIRNKIKVDNENAVNTGKNDAINAIKKAVTEKLAEIEKADILPADKDVLKTRVNTERDNGITDINKLTEILEINKKRDLVVKTIREIDLGSFKKAKAEKDLADAKKLGIEAIEKAARDKISEIENADLLPSDKEKLKGQVNAEKTKGIDAVNKATTVSGAKSESDKAVGIIKAISLDAGKRAKAEKDLADAKKLGVEAIEKAARDKISEIENADLLPADKDKLKGQVNAEKTKGIDAVNKATTVSGAKSESDKAVGIIKAIILDQAKKAKLDLDTTRRDAIKAVRDKGEELLKDLERRNLDSKEKSKLKDKIIQIVDDAVKNIGEANRNQIDPLKNKAIKDLEDLISEIKKLEQDKINRDNEELAKKTLDQLKADAKKKVTDEYNRIKDEVNKMDLDEAVKKYLLKGLDDFHKKGLGLIDGATKDDVLKIRDGVISDMNKVLDDANTRLRAKKEKEQLDLDKQKAKEKIKAEYEKQQNRIKVVNVSAKLKADLIRELVDRYGKGIADIDGSDRNGLGKVVDDTVRDLIRIADKAVDAEKAERERLERETLEKERSEKERLAREKAEKERLEKERLAREKAEAERLAKEKAEAERLAKEKAEKERLAKEKAEKERLAREKAEKERLGREKAEVERLAREKAERERLEKERLERERLEKERLERERLEKERLERERLEKERLAREKAEAERLAREKAEAERLAREKAEKERLEGERLAREKAEKERLEVERLAREKAEKERLERERLAKEEAERLAREKSERERLARENSERLAELEADRLAREKAEIERIAREVREKREKELVERNRLDHEKYLKDRLAREKTERLVKEKADAERLAKEEAERLAKEKAEADRLAKEKAEQERLAKERAERERLAKEDAERLAREKAEVDRLSHEKAERLPKESVKPTIKQAKLPETGNTSMANYGLIGLVLGLLTRFKRRKN